MKSKYRLPIYMIAVLLLAIVIADISWWIYITSQYETFAEMVPAYLDIFPSFLQNTFWVTVLCIYLLGVSAFIFIYSITINYLKTLSIVLAGLSSLLLCWQVFSLM